MVSQHTHGKELDLKQVNSAEQVNKLKACGSLVTSSIFTLLYKQ